MKLTYETLIIKVRTIKIKTKTTVITIIPAAAPATPGNGYNKNYISNGMSNNTKSTLQDKPTNVQVTLTGPVNQDQLFKIQEVLRHPSQYRD